MRTTLALAAFPFFCLALGSTALAQFSLPNEIMPADGALRSHAVDVDGDGALDILTAAPNEASLFWSRNLGGIEFSDPILISADLPFISNLTWADLDGDGDGDLITACQLGPNLAWFENLGAGNFGALQLITDQKQGTWSVEAEDMDLDGDLDLVLAAFVVDEVCWFPNDGTGAFGPPVVLSSALDGAIDCLTVDVDQDGDPDVVSAAHNGARIDWFENDGAGGFSGPFTISNVVINVVYLAKGDLDQDGITDIVFSTDLTLAGLFLGTGTGFGPLQSLPGLSPDCFGLDIGDIDRDGIPDIAKAIQTPAQAVYHPGLGGGQFGAQIKIRQGLFMNGLNDIKLADLDGDADLDVVLSARTADRSIWIENLALLGMEYCQAVPNSTGQAGQCQVTGSPFAQDNETVLRTESLPPNVFSFFLISPTQDFIPNPGGSQGNLCLGGAIGRYSRPGEVQSTGQAGRTLLAIDLTDTPTPGGSTSILMGQSWNYQAWHRDTVQGMPTSNFTAAVSLMFQ